MVSFGWSYPPGCNGPPEEPDMDPRVEEVWAMLEDAGVSENVIADVCQIIEQLAIEADAKKECDKCLERYAQEEIKAQQDLEKYWDKLEKGKQ